MISQGEVAPAAAPARRTSLGVIFLVLFLDLVGFSILFPLYPEMLHFYGGQDSGLLGSLMRRIHQQFPHASQQQAEALFGGLLNGGYSLIQFVTAPFWGRLSDRVGRRPILLLSVTGGLISYVVWIFAADFRLLVASRALAGLMGGSAVGAMAAVADTTPGAKERSRAMALVGMAFGLGFILGPAIGGISHAVLPRLDGHPSLAALGFNPFSATAIVAAALSLVNLVWAIRRFRETLPVESRQQPRPNERTANPMRLFSLRFGPTVLAINVATFLHTVLFGGMELTLGFLLAERMRYGTAGLAAVLCGMGFASALVQGMIFRRLAPRIGPRPLGVAGFALLVPGFLLIGAIDPWPSPLLLVVGVVVLASGTGLVFPALNTLVSLAADERNQGFVMGTWRSAGSLGRALGPLIAAGVYFGIGPYGPYVVGAIGICIPLILLARLRPRVASS